ncbi:MAG TPA: hypothetical protein VFR29_02885 [Steroidobacteraceae bacterium]|nr:hypothetical protein [Steroidobacteraceae bacterium]
MNRIWIAIAACGLAGGCALLPDSFRGCVKPQPYQSAQEVPVLQVPPGADAPDTRNALRIPAVPAPERPAEAGRCLDHPPAYGRSRPQGE